jgi:hypothetical protein
MVKHIKIESTLAKIANVVFETKDFNYAKQVALEHLEESTIKESDRLKMIQEITNTKNLERLQVYVANSLLKYEGLSLTKTKPTQSESDENDEI